ncbi:MAG: hypothetical protein K0V04_21400 [Deltaproteobacteria bacterium]|nr:hypothetical protein [Deltaproteobacteria bacterium]
MSASSDPEPTQAEPTGTERMLALGTERLGRMHRTQVHRDPWPQFEQFDPTRYDATLRRAAAVQWAGRARAEHGSVHQFTIVAHTLCNTRSELPVLGALSRLITDEVRHAELCAEMALACWPEGTQTEPAVFRWEPPRAPWRMPPGLEDQPVEPLLAWAAEAILISCCIGETLSRPMLEAIAVVATEPLADAVARQILRDEHLHATFGWETLALLVPRLSTTDKRALQKRMARAFAGVEATTACGVSVEQVAGKTIAIERGDAPNLGTLTDEQYAMIFFATMENEVLPRMEAVGLEAWEGWRSRHAS